MQNLLSGIELCYDLAIRYGNEHAKSITTDNFSSLRFTRLFLNNNLPGSTTCSCLDHTEAHDDLEVCIDSVIQYINTHSGFTIVGWCKRGDIVDVSKE